MMSDWKVELVNDSVNELYVEFQGPKDSEQYLLTPLMLPAGFLPNLALIIAIALLSHI